MFQISNKRHTKNSSDNCSERQTNICDSTRTSAVTIRTICLVLLNWTWTPASSHIWESGCGHIDILVIITNERTVADVSLLAAPPVALLIVWANNQVAISCKTHDSTIVGSTGVHAWASGDEISHIPVTVWVVYAETRWRIFGHNSTRASLDALGCHMVVIVTCWRWVGVTLVKGVIFLLNSVQIVSIQSIVDVCSR